MKLPRNLGAQELIKGLKRLGYVVVRQSGSHIRLQTQHPSVHHITIPNHDPLKVGTLAAILAEIARHQGIDRERLLEALFGN